MKELKNVAPQFRSVIQDLITLLTIDNEYRGPNILNELNNLIEQIKKQPFSPSLMPIIEYYTLVAKHGLNGYHPKAWLSTPHHRPDCHAYCTWGPKVEIHLMWNVLDTLMHEIVHAVLILIWNVSIPMNNAVLWQEATSAFLRDFLSLKPHAKSLFSGMLSPTIKDLSSKTAELPSFIASFILLYNRLPNESDGFSDSADLIEKSFMSLKKSVNEKIAEFKQNLKPDINKIELYHSLNRNPSHLFIEKHIVSDLKMGFHPLHIVSTRGNESLMYRFLSHGRVSMEDQDNFGNTPIHCAVRFNRENILNFVFRQSSYSPLLECDETTWAPLQMQYPTLINNFMRSIGEIYYLLKSVANGEQLAIGTNFIIFLMGIACSKDILTKIFNVSMRSLSFIKPLANMQKYRQSLIYSFNRRLVHLEPSTPMPARQLL